MSRPRLAIILIVIAAAARVLSLTWLHPLNWDEIEYFRATDWVRQGLVPYRDFWEHHTPLQWFVFAPVAALIRSPGASAIIAMRWAQVPLWILTFFLFSIWMRRAGLSLVARLGAISLALCSSLFMLPAVEYRIDAMGCALYAAALVLLQDSSKSWFAFAGGAALCLAGLANLRLGPLLALTAVLYAIVRRRAAIQIFIGVIATLALCATYFMVTHSASIAFRRLWTDNYLADRLSEGTGGVFLHRIIGVFGIRLLPQRSFEPASIEVATIFILVLGTIGIVRTLIIWRGINDLFVLACLQIGSILFIAMMKFVYTYHFEITILLMLPFVAAELEKLDWRLVVTALVVASGVNVFASVFRGKEADLAYQDLIVREADRLTKPGDKVFDGVGWALRRRPAYRYWFLPKLVQTFEAKGLFEPYDMQVDPPAAIITDHNAYVWLTLHPSLASFATAHYLPYWRNLWVPAMSARLNAGEFADWIVPATGTYRIYASSALATHPWFTNALAYGTFESHSARISLLGFRRTNLAWTIDGIAVPPTDTLRLKRGQQLRALAPGGPLGVMIVPNGIRSLFQQPPHGVTLDAAAPPVTHIPFR